MRVRVARIGIDRRQRGLARGPVVGMRRHPTPDDLRGLHHHPLRPYLPDDPTDVTAQLQARSQRSVPVTQEAHVEDPDLGRGRLLLRAADARDVGTGHRGRSRRRRRR